MIKEEVIIHTEKIEKLGQSRYFQVQLPKDTQRIIGIETGVFREISGQTASGMDAYVDNNPVPYLLMNPENDDAEAYDPLFNITKVETIGRLTLHSASSIIYQAEVRQNDISPKYADFAQYPTEFGQWSHDRKRFETDVQVKHCIPIIEGHFKDSWGLFYSYHVIYQLNIYVWIEK